MKELKTWEDYFSHKNRLRRPRYTLSPWMRDMINGKYGRYLSLYDVQERYKLGGDDKIHKLTEYEFS
jgi:hypothetical protein